MSLPALLRAYLALTAALPALLTAMARRAHARQGAAPARWPDRLGQPTAMRPPGRMVWIHAASVGEVVSVAALAERLAGRGLSVLLTTTTATGAEMAARRVPRALHQFQPLDTPAAVAGFLDHWRPDAALFVEGDLWPRMVLTLARRGIPMALLNARASRSRARFPRVWRALLSHMAVVTVQADNVRDDLLALGLDPARLHMPGDLKADVAAPPVDPALTAAIAAAAAGRRVWAAVSTHPGEEAMALAAQARLPGAPLLLLMPRHPDRGAAVAAEIAAAGLRVARRSTGALPDATTQVYLMDTLGETGSAYAAAGLVLVGGALHAGPGGHTPHEPAALGCAILSGPHVANFAQAYARLAAQGAAVTVADATAIAQMLGALWSDPPRLAAMQAAARAAHDGARGATERTLRLILPLLARDKPAPQA